MYSVNLKNVVPQGGLTCLFAKATLDEYNLWHRRLGHINFKTMNKPVRGNLVRGNRLEVADGNVDNKSKEISQEDMKKSRWHPEIKTAETWSGPEWLFDIDTLTKSMNYKPVVAPDSPISSSLKSSNDDVVDDAEKKSTKDPTKESDQDDQDLKDEFASGFERSILQ
ncbi:ribonuclease H-like domain-containing protein, partial [Tanacetum coccineum]